MDRSVSAKMPRSGLQFGSVNASGSSHVHLGDQYYYGTSSEEQILNSLPNATKAVFNSRERQHDPLCLPNTRVDLLNKIRVWVEGQDERCIFWLNGWAGTGKSTIARTIAREYRNQKRLGASFFFSRGSGDVSHAGKFFTSIATQLACWSPDLKRDICEAVEKQNNIAGQAFSDQWAQLVLGPLSKLEAASFRPSLVLVVDALDECDGHDDIRVIVQLLAKVRSIRTVRIRVLLTSRPDTHVHRSFSRVSPTDCQDFVLHQIESSIVDHDLSTFLEHNFKEIRQESTLDAAWPGRATIDCLVRKSGGLFIWAATACLFIRKGRRAERQLSLILEGDPSVKPQKALDEIYTKVLRNSVLHDWDEHEREEFYEDLRVVLGGIVILFTTLSTSPLAGLLNMPKRNVNLALEGLHSILDIPKEQDLPIRLHHPSFRDFLLDNQRCTDPHFWVEEREAHRSLTESCLRLMSSKLRRDICDLRDPGARMAEIRKERIQQCLPSELQYACLYWVQHLQRSKTRLYDNGDIHIFLQEHFLHWLEALGLMQKVSDGIRAIISLGVTISAKECPDLHKFIYDAKRVILQYRQGIEEAPLQVYYSALVFIPESSAVRRQFKDQVPKWIRKITKMQTDWSALQQTLEGHTGWVEAVAFSPDGRQLASASWDKTVRLWDPTTGTLLQRLEGHTDKVCAVAFSPDGRQLASASRDETVRLWDPTTGTLLQRLEGHTSWVEAVAFSPDGRQLASASLDETVRLWDPTTGAPCGILQINVTVRELRFSGDGQALDTDRGLLGIRALSPIHTSFASTPGGTIFVDGPWVIQGMQRILWLPFDYRATAAAVHNHVLAMGHESGRVSMLRIG